MSTNAFIFSVGDQNLLHMALLMLARLASQEFKLAETGVLHYASSCHMCGVNLCETGQVLDANDEAIENFQLG